MKKTITTIALSLAGYLFVLPHSGKAQYTKLLDYAGASNGAGPSGSLISDGTFLYALASSGGANNDGTILKINQNGTGYVKLLDFAGSTNGSVPKGSFYSDGTFLYGMTSAGGGTGNGTIFKIKPNGTGYSLLYAFTGNPDGSAPYGALISDGTYLYGMTSVGGINNSGIIFRILPNGTGYLKLHDFGGSGTNGAIPYGSLFYDGTYLYGMTEQGGSAAYGTVFRMAPNGTAYSILHNFVNDGTDGFNPRGSLISDGTFLYGMTTAGNANNGGILFKISPNGTGYSIVYGFIPNGNGTTPSGDLVYDGTFLYGMTQSDGSNNMGVVFEIMPNGTAFSKLLDFTGSNGINPTGSLILNGGALYGMAYGGGTNSNGVVFKFCLPVTVTANTTTTTVCAGDPVTLTGSGATSYTWSGGVTNGVPFVPSSTTTYTVAGANAGGCSNTSTISISVNPLPVLTYTQNPNSVCINNTPFALSVGSPTGGTYSGPGVSGTNFDPSTAGTGTTTISYSYTDVHGCSNTISQNIVVNLCTGISHYPDPISISVYPNPFTNELTIESPVPTKATVHNMLGEKISEFHIQKATQTIDLSNVTPGIYYVRIMNEQIKIVRQ